MEGSDRGPPAVSLQEWVTGDERGCVIVSTGTLIKICKFPTVAFPPCYPCLSPVVYLFYPLLLHSMSCP